MMIWWLHHALIACQALRIQAVRRALWQRWADLKGSDAFCNNAKLRDSSTAMKCEALVAALERDESWQVMRDYEITVDHWLMATILMRMSERKQVWGRRFQEIGTMRMGWELALGQRRYKKNVRNKLHLVEILIGKLEQQAQALTKQ